MDQVLPSQSSAAGLLEPDSEELQLRVESFRKLGYSSEEVRSALRKLGLSTDTNSVLGELVRINASSASSVSLFEGDERSLGQRDALLPPSWTLGPRNTPQPSHQQNVETELRPVVIDGSNVAMSHGNKEVFSCRGIQLAVNFFLERGHNNITVFVPSWRKELPRPDAPITDQHILTDLEKCKIVVFTPSRRVGGKRVVCYDDRFIVKLAYESDGVIISNDTYRDLQGERPEWKKCIEERLLMYSFVNDKFMPPDDPLGRHGPNLDNFLRKNPLPPEQKRQLCPYDKKCTYGMKCKFYHPERVNQTYLSLADELREKAQISTPKEEKSTRVSARQLQLDAGHAHPPDAPAEFSRNGLSALHPSHITDNHLLYREDPGKGSSPLPPAGQSQKDWTGLHMMPSLYYPNLSQEYLDSGFGSFESQYSDHSHYLGNSPRVTSQQQAMQVGKNGGGHSGFSHPVRNPAQQQHLRKRESERQPSFPQIYPPGVPHPQSLSGPLQYSGVSASQQNYWSDPFQGLPQARTSCGPSSSHPSLTAREFHSWGHQPPSFDPRRMELRKKLQAIFNPQEVDAVMDMFPQLMDAEKLAAKILNMKAKRGIF